MASRNRIHVRNPYGKIAYTYYPVLVIGAGASGIAMGCRLKDKLGFDQFRIFDRQSGLEVGQRNPDIWLHKAIIY